jgi:hypothetical protein
MRYQFPKNYQAVNNSLYEQINKVREETTELREEIVGICNVNPQAVCREAWDVIQAAEGVLRKFPDVIVENAYDSVEMRCEVRGDYTDYESGTLEDGFHMGDWVVNKADGKIGRVAATSRTIVLVCFRNACLTADGYSQGCLRLATSQEIEDAPTGIGFHRFDDYCEDEAEGICESLCRCNAKRAMREAHNAQE